MTKLPHGAGNHTPPSPQDRAIKQRTQMSNAAAFAGCCESENEGQSKYGGTSTESEPTTRVGKWTLVTHGRKRRPDMVRNGHHLIHGDTSNRKSLGPLTASRRMPPEFLTGCVFHETSF